MATATTQLSEDQFLCSICLDVFTDPVTLPCGHNFCKTCINQHWSDTVIYKCPYCNKRYNSRPELMVNTFIAEMAAHFRQSQHKASSGSEQQAAKPGEIPCDVCTDPKQKALKSCLVCLSSYCGSHLEPHLNMSGLKRHQLIEPQGNLEDRVCTQHNKLLELFCKNDQLCVCVLCTYSDHKSHEVVPLKEASEQQKLQLEKTKADFQEKINMRQMKIKKLRRSVRVSNEAADREILDGVKVFSALNEFVERGLDNLSTEITRKKTDTEDQVRGLIQELEQEICELKKRSTEVEQLSDSDDHLHLLQNFSHLSSAPPTKDWTNVTICSPTYEGTVARALSQLEHDFNKMTRSLFEAELKRVKTKEVNVTLDSDTAPPQLIVSYGKKVSHRNEQINLPYSPKRFDGLFVLGEESFSESFYFEAEVREKTEWTLGVVQESVNRKGPLTLNPQNGFWTIGLKNKSYYASDDPEITIFTKCRPEKVGVFVDYDGGLVSFYDVEAAALIYSFTGFTFKKKLYPFCSPGSSWRNSAPLVICGEVEHLSGFLKNFLKRNLN